MPGRLRDTEFIQLSAVQHYIFCQRQCALAYMEFVWEENYLTAKGHIFHDKVHASGAEKRRDVLEVRGLRISSERLGVSGQADLVEFHRINSSKKGVKIAGQKGLWALFPIEYKRGKPKQNNADRVQLCAQAMCLEEMLATEIASGAIFYGRNRRREQVDFTPELRNETSAAIAAIHAMFASGQTPRAVYSHKCDSCSLLSLCLPKQSGAGHSATKYLRQMLE
jgi:CRISPR-associated exonuclease Cas4